jgi:hypothetical protein
MDVMIEIDAPRLLPQLLSRLSAAGLSVRPVSLRECRVVDPRAADADDALCELRFFLSAWARAQGDVAVSIRRPCYSPRR